MTIFAGTGLPLTQAGIDGAIGALKINAQTLWAVLSVETSGCGFQSDRRPKLLFERHIFHRLTGGKWDAEDPDVSAPTPGGYGDGAGQYLRLEGAMQLDADAALMSASWGLGQIMGENYKSAGFGSVQGLVNAFVSSEDEQLVGMANFIRYSGAAASLQARDWTTFARRYNGPAYASNHYDGHLALFYAHLMTAGVPDLTVRACQIYLGYQGYSPGPIDGVVGPTTTRAATAFQTAAGLAPTGAVDQVLLAALSK